MKHGILNSTLSWTYPVPRINVISYSIHYIQSISEHYQIYNTKLNN